MDLVPITESQAKKLEAAGITVHVTYAIDKKLIELVGSLNTKPKRKKASKNASRRNAYAHHKVMRVVSTDVTKARDTSLRGRALRLLSQHVGKGEIVDRKYLDALLTQGGLDIAVNPWLVNELIRRGDLESLPPSLKAMPRTLPLPGQL